MTRPNRKPDITVITSTHPRDHVRLILRDPESVRGDGTVMCQWDEDQAVYVATELLRAVENSRHLREQREKLGYGKATE